MPKLKTKKPKVTQIGKVSLRSKAQDTHVAGAEVLITPKKVKAKLPGNKKAFETVLKGRKELESILDHQDRRLFVVLGPCSIHDPQAAYEYATKLKRLAGMVSSTMLLIMRVYFEKPRTTIGWKGLINDPDMNDSFHIEKGILLARRLLLKFTEMGLPTATEALDPIIPQYIADLISWSAIGARTTESQTHREMASGLSMPVGLKNATDGSLQIAIDAMSATRHAHSFLGMHEDGATSIVRTSGNPHAHVVLRGGRAKTNYDAASIRAAEEKLISEKLQPVLMVDCSHANSEKQHARQEDVWRSVIQQRVEGTRSLIGLMVESHLSEGNQPIPKNLKDLRYGVSLTDSCIGWETTERMLRWGYETLGKIIPAKASAA